MIDVIRKILYLLYQHNKITKKFTANNRVIIVMAVYIDDNKHVIIKEPKSIRTIYLQKSTKAQSMIFSLQ